MCIYIYLFNKSCYVWRPLVPALLKSHSFPTKTVYVNRSSKVAHSLKIANPHGTSTCKCCDAGPPPLRVIVYCLVGKGTKKAGKLRGSPTDPDAQSNRNIFSHILFTILYNVHCTVCIVVSEINYSYS